MKTSTPLFLLASLLVGCIFGGSGTLGTLDDAGTGDASIVDDASTARDVGDVASPGDAGQPDVAAPDAARVDAAVDQGVSTDGGVLTDGGVHDAGRPDAGERCLPACTPCERCDNGTCVPREDGAACSAATRPCEEATCRSGICRVDLRPDSCLIEGTCFSDGDPNPAIDSPECQVCNPTFPMQWSNTNSVCAPDECYQSAVCVAGSCLGQTEVPDGTSCGANQVCAKGVCVTPGGCSIGALDYATGTINPSNDCEVCDPLRDLNGWSPRAGGTVCTTFEAECMVSTCDAAGHCRMFNDPNANSCSGAGPCPQGASAECTSGVCNCAGVTSTNCSDNDGNIFGIGFIRPGNPCERCELNGWTDRPDGSACMDGTNPGSCMMGACMSF